jgi:hypothetical protein
MIEELEILQFSIEEQREIRKGIARMLENGYDLKYLLLTHRGEILSHIFWGEDIVRPVSPPVAEV